MNDPRPVILFDGDCNFCNAIVFRRLACVLALAGLLCVSSAQGQVIREEGFPVKGGVPEESAWAPVVREECDPFTVPGEFGESCAPREKTPDPFGFGPEGEARPGEPSGPAWRTPPRLECPVAIFLEELETGAIECYAWDASGEERLEYSWEPVGSTTRDYLNNPRLIPEDAPNPSVVAPEAPVYEMLESFRSGGTTFLYRYRLTATSRATGLFSHEEVEVYVSGSRPSVYCPLEVAVEEGETVSLDCEGVDPLSHRMDYDEDGASILWEWEGLWGTSTLLLDATDMSSALFTAPAGSAGEEYHYIASMTSQASGMSRTARRRVTVRVADQEVVSTGAADPSLTCADSEVYEGAVDFTLDCSVANEPSGATYRWTGTDIADRLTNTDSLTPTFSVPDDIDEPGEANKDYEYTVTMTVGGVEQASEDVTVTVLEKPDINCRGTSLNHTFSEYGFPEGYGPSKIGGCHRDWEGAPAGSSYTYTWTVRGSTPEAALSLLDPANDYRPFFLVPAAVTKDEIYKYKLTVSAENADPNVSDYKITVINTSDEIDVVCAPPAPVYEGTDDFEFDCAASGAPGDSPDYTYLWTGDASAMALLDADDVASPTFLVPETVEKDERYEYLLTVSAENADPAKAGVTVTVLDTDTPAPVVTCSDSEVYEDSEDFTLDCSVTNEASGATYTWAARGSTSGTSQLSSTTILKPTFFVPDDIDEPDGADKDYEYTVTMTVGGVEQASEDITVTVLEKPDISCVRSNLGYEGEVSPGEIRRFDPCPGGFRGAPAGSDYVFNWIPVRTAYVPEEAALAALDRTDMATAVFTAPTVSPHINSRLFYTYKLMVSAENADPLTLTMIGVSVVVRNRPELSVTCSHSFYEVNEGDPDFYLDCKASGAWFEYTYTWQWFPTDKLTGHDTGTPRFNVPGDVDRDTTYVYAVRVTARGHHPDEATVEVRVIDTTPPPVALALVCADPGSVYEGSEDIAFDCSASGAPGDNPQYTYAWTARGDTPDTALLVSGADGPTPTFDVPEEVDEDETYEYLLTVSAENAIDAVAEVSVTVLNKGALAVVCTDPGSVYEGSADIAFDCAASGAPAGSAYEYEWTARNSTANTDLLIAGTDGPTPTFDVPEEVDEDETYEYLLTVSAENAVDAAAEVSVTVLNKGALALVCVDPGSVYEGSEDITFDCSASGAPGDNPQYTYAWAAQGDTPDTALLVSGADGPAPTFDVPEEVDEDETYEYLLTVSAANAIDAVAEVSVTVLNKGALAVACADPGSVYEGSADITFDCSASGAPGDNPQYTYVWTALGDTPDTALLSAGADGPTPTFDVPEEVNEDETYEYLLTVSAANAIDAAAEVSVTVLNKGALALVCADPGSVYEGSADIAFDCSASGAPAGSAYEYAWTARGSTTNTALLSAADIASPVFAVPEEVDATTTYEYLLTVSADNAESVTEDVTVTVLDRIQTPAPDPVSPPVDSPPLASSSAREPSDPSALGVTVSASSLRFGVQSSQTEVSLDPLTDGISTRVSGPYHAGRMTLSPGGGEALDENGEMSLSIELASPVVLRREGGIEAASLVLSPSWSYAESCEQLSSQAIGGLYTEATLTEGACRLLRFGGELDLTDTPSGRYAGSMDIVLRSGESEETHSVEVEVTVVPSQRVITIGPGGVRFSTSRELAAGLTEEQNLSIYPDVAFLTEGKPHGVFELSNPSLVPLEVSVSARFGYTEATEDGREVVVEDASDSRLGDLSQVVDVHPGVLVLMPGEKGLVRYGVQEGALASMSEQGYAAFFDVVSSPRQYVRSDRMPEEVTGERTARVTMRVPGVYVPGEGASQLRATLLSISYVGSVSATFLLETQDRPFAGEVVAYDGQGRELGRRETLVYTRSRVRVPLDRMPEEEVVFLRFAPWGSSRVPEPASVEWDAPRRDIGAAGDKERTTTLESTLQ